MSADAAPLGRPRSTAARNRHRPGPVGPGPVAVHVQFGQARSAAAGAVAPALAASVRAQLDARVARLVTRLRVR